MVNKKGLGQANILRTNNNTSTGYGVAYADEVSGHRTVANLTALYALNDWQLSASGNNADNDAIGQLWYVVNADGNGNGCYYQLKDWSKRKEAAGWQQFKSFNPTSDLLEYVNKNELAATESAIQKQIATKANAQDVTNAIGELQDSINNIAITGGASTAAAVTFDNAASGMTAITAQEAIEELNVKKLAKADIEDTIENGVVSSAKDIFTENLRVVDSKGREILEVGNHIKTKDFDSEQVTDNIAELQETGCKTIPVSLEGLTISDESGNAVAKFKHYFDGDSVLQNISDIANTIDALNNPIKYRTKFPPINYKKEEFRWLDIGNSASFCAFYYLKRIAISQEVDLTNTSFTLLSRGAASFKSMYEGYHNLDTSGEGDNLTGGIYQISKTFGDAPIKVTGNSYTEPHGTPTQVIDKNVTEIPITFWGGDGSLFRSLLADNKFDVISIQATSLKVPYYDSTNGWTDNSDNGYFLEFIRLLKTLQPQATIVCYYSYINWSVAKSLNGLNTLEISYYNKIKDFLSKSGIDILIPCEMALSNLRNSSVPNALNEGTGTPEDINSRTGFNYDSAHIAWGVAAYTMSCAAWETILAPRFDKSCYGNTYRELIEDDIIYTPSDSNTTFKYMQGSYTDSNGHKVMIDNGAYNSPIYNGCTSIDGGSTWDYSNALSTIRVSDSNAKTCQMAAILAVNDMFNITNPDNKDI